MGYYNMTGSVVKEVNELLDELEDILTGIRLLGELSPRSIDRLASFGERFSARLLSARLNQIGVPAYAFDAWDIGMFTTTEFGHARPLPEAQDAIRKAFDRIDPSVVAVVPGGNGHEQEHHITTLGREGIHLTAKTIASALKIKDIHGWKDVDGALARSVKHLGPSQ
jgi:aspartate kinase